MAEQYRFFGSAEGDTRQYNQTEFAEVLSRLLKNGYFPEVDNELEVVASDPADMTVEVKSGQAWINGYWYKNDSNKVLNINPAHATLNRIDRVALRLDIVNDRKIEAVVIQGTPASNPVPPALTRTSQIYEISLAQIYVAAGVTSISQSAITDERDDINVCGKAVPYYVPTNDDISNTAEPNKILRLDNNSQLPASADMLDGKHASDFILKAERVAPWTPGNFVIFDSSFSASVSDKSTTSNVYTKVAEFKIGSSGGVRISFQMAASEHTLGYAQIYVNGAPVGVERVKTGTSSSSTGRWTKYTEDISNLNVHDLVQIYCKNNGDGKYDRTYIRQIQFGIGGRADTVEVVL